MAPAPEADREEEEELGTRGPLPGQLKMNGEDGGVVVGVSNGEAMVGGVGDGGGRRETPLPVLSGTHSADTDWSENGTENVGHGTENAENQSRKRGRSRFKRMQTKLKDLVRIMMLFIRFKELFISLLNFKELARNSENSSCRVHTHTVII